MKKSQFSLRRLFLYITVLCVVLGVALGFPVATASVTVKLLLVAPALDVAGASNANLSRFPRKMLLKKCWHTLSTYRQAALLGWW